MTRSGQAAASLTSAQAALLGLDQSGLVAMGKALLRPEVARAFERLADAARVVGFELAIASAFRDFNRQLLIWNRKACGELVVRDDQDCAVPMQTLSVEEQLTCILRFSALPGASRHHWGTDLDVYDAAAMPEGYTLQLTPSEAAPDGLFGALHAWLDERIRTGTSFGFYRPYDEDRGGVAVERWHLSYAPLAVGCEEELTATLLRRAWDECAPGDDLALREALEVDLDQILERFVGRVATAPAAARDYHDQEPGP